MVEVVKKGEGVYELDLRGYTCPYPVMFTRKYFSMVKSGEELHVIIDNAPSCETVPSVVEELGGVVVSIDYVGNGVFRIVARRK